MSDEESNTNSEINQAVIEKLFESRIIFLAGDINEAKSQEAVSRLITLDYQNPLRDILFYIDSYGGDVHSFIAIHDAMKMIRCDVATIGVGKVMSAAAMLLLSGTIGKRFITPNSRVMIHQISAGDEGNLSYLKNSIAEVEKLQVLFEQLVKKYTKMSIKQIGECFKKDTYMDAVASKRFGIVDYIIDDPNCVSKIVKL